MINNNIIVNDKCYTQEQKEMEPEDKDSDKKGRGPKYTLPAPGCPDWQVYRGKVLYWCNVCNVCNA
eukprot:4560070-Ditylum_brightwellii.AAC.1